MQALLLMPSSRHAMTRCQHRGVSPYKGPRPVKSAAYIVPSIFIINRGYSTVESGLHPAYFTGDPKYYDALIKVNNALKQRGITDLNSTKPYDNIKTPAWMNIDDMKRVYSFRMDETTYNAFVHRLNLLYTKRFKEVAVGQKPSDNEQVDVWDEAEAVDTGVKEGD